MTVDRPFRLGLGGGRRAVTAVTLTKALERAARAFDEYADVVSLTLERGPADVRLRVCTLIADRERRTLSVDASGSRKPSLAAQVADRLRAGQSGAAGSAALGR
ncbi:hypothetical protein [Nonomuraea sp. NPDC049750]|uniref:hypothetical protein n=1 Tax=Nonomuraea sp. NPDC049750 TaxID=3154738 RepID=UPI0033CBB5C6